MAKEKKDKHFIKKPIFEGGPKAMKAFVSQHLQYPEEALENKVEGTVVVHYTIDYQGNVTEAKVVSGPGFGCDEEACRVVKLMRFEVPKSRGVRVAFHQHINIHFRLPKPVKKPQKSTSVVYRYEYTESAEKKDKPEGNPGYSYTVNW